MIETDEIWDGLFINERKPLPEKNTPGTCDNCGKKKETTTKKLGVEDRQICSTCEASVRPYLKDTPQTETERVGGIRIK